MLLHSFLDFRIRNARIVGQYMVFHGYQNTSLHILILLSYLSDEINIIYGVRKMWDRLHGTNGVPPPLAHHQSHEVTILGILAYATS